MSVLSTLTHTHIYWCFEASIWYMKFWLFCRSASADAWLCVQCFSFDLNFDTWSRCHCRFGWTCKRRHILTQHPKRIYPFILWHRNGIAAVTYKNQTKPNQTKWNEMYKESNNGSNDITTSISIDLTCPLSISLSLHAHIQLCVFLSHSKRSEHVSN